MTASMAVNLGRDNIRVNCIAPGHLYTPMVARNMTDEMRDLRRRAGPLGTEGTAWDIAWTNVFLASDESRWISGGDLTHRCRPAGDHTPIYVAPPAIVYRLGLGPLSIKLSLPCTAGCNTTK